MFWYVFLFVIFSNMCLLFFCFYVNLTEKKTVDFYVNVIDNALVSSIKNGLDHELILAKVLASHSFSEESDLCHIYGITFGEKMQNSIPDNLKNER